MAEIILNSEDLEKLPKELRDGLKDYIFGKNLAPDSDAKDTALEEISDIVQKIEGASGEEKDALLEKYQALTSAPLAVDAMSLEAAIAFLFGLDPASSLPCLEYFINNGPATKETLAQVAGKKDSKGVNGLIGSINRRFKSLFLHPDTNQNIITYLKGEKVYLIDEAFHPALRFGLWAVRSDVDWESCKQIIWPIDQEEIEYTHGGLTDEGEQTSIIVPMPVELKLNIESIRGFISKTKLGYDDYVGSSDRQDDGTDWGVYNRVLTNCEKSNYLFATHTYDLNFWYLGNEIKSTGFGDHYYQAFFNPNPDYGKLGRLVQFYRKHLVPVSHGGEISNKNIRWYPKGADMEADYGKFGLFACSDAPSAIGGDVGAFLWFKDEAAALEYIEQVLPFEPTGPSGTNSKLVAAEVQKLTDRRLNSAATGEYKTQELVSDLNSVLKNFFKIEWMGNFEDLINAKAQGEFLISVREEFFDNLDKDPYEGPIKQEDADVFKDTLNTFGF